MRLVFKIPSEISTAKSSFPVKKYFVTRCAWTRHAIVGEEGVTIKRIYYVTSRGGEQKGCWMLLKQQKTKHILTSEVYSFLCFTCKSAKKGNYRLLLLLLSNYGIVSMIMNKIAWNAGHFASCCWWSLTGLHSRLYLGCHARVFLMFTIHCTAHLRKAIVNKWWRHQVIQYSSSKTECRYPTLAPPPAAIGLKLCTLCICL